MIFFIKNPNLEKKICGWEGGGGWGVARVRDFFSKESKSDKYFFSF